MNCKQFNKVPLEEVLLKLGHLPTRKNEKETWFLNPFGTETAASFKIDLRQNLWYLFSEGTGGTNTDFMLKYLKTDIAEVLKWAEGQSFSSFGQQRNFENHLNREKNQTVTPIKISPNPYEITAVKNVQNKNLKNYLNQRGLSEKVYPFVKEVHFKMNDKNLYAVGFENISGGWELRNAFYKGALLRKDISIIKNAETSNFNSEKIQNKISVFEGFMDALSFIEMSGKVTGDLLVMNSIALLTKAKNHLQNYSEIDLFLDNDRAGKFCTESILKSFPEAKDRSEVYEPHKDLNEFLLSKIENNLEKNPGSNQFEEVEGISESEPLEINNETVYKRRR